MGRITEIGGPVMARTWVKDIRTWPAPVPEEPEEEAPAAAADEPGPEAEEAPEEPDEDDGFGSGIF